ncbi:uncharacterized protein [Triticum aestivum]|uniref:uncharacterized protein n=1 Tax=Triticum aestivum TaxID=4565 RepID=UPI001D03443F|nr:uncharacterized protein LOC123083046 [Triticum aestivum]
MIRLVSRRNLVAATAIRWSPATLASRWLHTPTFVMVRSLVKPMGNAEFRHFWRVYLYAQSMYFTTHLELQRENNELGRGRKGSITREKKMYCGKKDRDPRAFARGDGAAAASTRPVASGWSGGCTDMLLEVPVCSLILSLGGSSPCPGLKGAHLLVIVLCS